MKTVIDTSKKEKKCRWSFCRVTLLARVGIKVKVYHGANSRYIAKIKRDGLKSNLGYGQGWYMVATDLASALYHATPFRNKPAFVFEFNVPTSAKGRWEGYPWFWPPSKRTTKSKWFAPMKQIPSNFITNIKTFSYKKWLERKSKGF